MSIKTDILDYSPRYKRGQAVWALRQYFAYDNCTDVEAIFTHRIKRLQSLDNKYPDYTDAPILFPQQRQSGKGTDNWYTAFDVFCLCIALELLDIGINQKEVLFATRFLRNGLHVRYQLIMKKTKIVNYKKYKTTHDSAEFLLFNKTEFTELFPEGTLPDHEGPLVYPPKFCSGFAKLENLLISHLNKDSKTLLIELSAPAIKITGLLADAPLKKRGIG